jgi:hypothetical protein
MSKEVLVARRYTLLDRIGIGGMGEVWRTHDQLTGQTLAIKILRPPIAAAPAAELRFQREIRAMARLHHPRIVPVVDAGTDPVVGLFFVMELQTGRPLHEMSSHWNSWAEIWPILDQILETLAHAHSHSVIHRDIKPDNILVNMEGEAVLLDFGVARLKDRARSGTSAYDLLGTVDYAAPEQATGNRRRIGPWTDVYCFAIVLYEIICGRVPFWSSSPVQSLIMRLNAGCPTLDPRPGLATPEGLWEVLDRMLQPEPFHRFRTAAEARNALAALTDSPLETLTPQIDGFPLGSHETSTREQVTDDEASTLFEHRKALLTSTFEGTMGTRPPEAPLRTATLVGRDELLLSLSRGLDHWVTHPSPGVLVLTGAMGSGKTRLIREMLSPFLAQGEIEAHHHQWRYGPSMRATMTGIAGAIGLRDETLKEHLEWFLDGHGVSETKRTELVDWLLEDDRGQRTERDTRLAGEFLKASSDERPFVLAIDGVEAMDEQVLGIIRAVRKGQLPVIVALAGSHPRIMTDQEMPSWLQSAERLLEPLNEEQLGRIIDELVTLNEHDRNRLVRRAHGNPKRLFDMLYEMRRSGDIIPASPKWREAPESWVPIDAAASGMYSIGSSDLSGIIDDENF